MSGWREHRASFVSQSRIFRGETRWCLAIHGSPRWQVNLLETPVAADWLGKTFHGKVTASSQGSLVESPPSHLLSIALLHPRHFPCARRCPSPLASCSNTFRFQAL